MSNRKWTEDHTLHRRTYLTLAGLSIGAGGTITSALATGNTVDLGKKGLSSGDEIDPYLEEYFVNGNEVRIPEGSYTWNGGGLGYVSNAALIGEGTVEFHRPNKLNAKVACTSGTVLVKNITIRGKAGANYSSIRLSARSSDAQVIAENFNQPDGSVTESRATGIFVPPEHAGELVLRDCHIEGFADNGLYADSPGGHPTYTPREGTVIVEGGLYKNNNVANVRIGSPNSIVRNVTMVQDEKTPVQIGGGHRQRCLRISQPGEDILVENCEIIQEYTGPGWAVDYYSAAAGGSGVIKDTTIQNESDTPAIRTHPDYYGDWRGDNVHIHGNGNLDYGIPIDPVCVGETCPDTDSSDPESEFDHTLTVTGRGDPTRYYFEATGEIKHNPAKGDLQQHDTIDGTNASGWVTTPSNVDSYRFDGDLLEVGFEQGAATVELDGEEINPDDYDGRPTLDNHLLVDGAGTSSGTRYEFTVSGEAEKATYKGSSINGEDTIESGHITGSVAGWRDAFRFSGDLEELTVDGPARVYVNDEYVDPAEYGDDHPHTLTLVGSGTDANYEISVDGTIKPVAADDAKQDVTVISKTTVEGSINRDVQRFRLSGALTDLTLTDGSAHVYLDGERIDPNEYGSQELLPHAIVINGTETDGESTYSFTVNGEVITSSYREATIDAEDEIEGKTVSGQVDDELDAYWFNGDIVDFKLKGKATVDIENNARSS